MTMRSLKFELECFREDVQSLLNQHFPNMTKVILVTRNVSANVDVKIEMDENDYLAEKLCDNDIFNILEDNYNIDLLFSIYFEIMLTSKA